MVEDLRYVKIRSEKGERAFHGTLLVASAVEETRWNKTKRSLSFDTRIILFRILKEVAA